MKLKLKNIFVVVTFSVDVTEWMISYGLSAGQKNELPLQVDKAHPIWNLRMKKLNL